MFWRFFAILVRIKEPFYLYDYKYALMFFFFSFLISHPPRIFPSLSYICDGLFLSFVLLSFMLFYVGFFFHLHHLWDFPFYGFFLRPLFYILFLIFRWIFIFQKMASTSGKRCTLSIEQKLEILEALKSKKPDDVAKDFNIGYSTVKKITCLW